MTGMEMNHEGHEEHEGAVRHVRAAPGGELASRGPNAPYGSYACFLFVPFVFFVVNSK